MNSINIQDILEKNGISELTLGAKQALKEIIEAVIDKCAEEAKLEYEPFYEDCDPWINQQSILAVKQMINYERGE